MYKFLFTMAVTKDKQAIINDKNIRSLYHQAKAVDPGLTIPGLAQRLVKLKLKRVIKRKSKEDEVKDFNEDIVRNLVAGRGFDSTLSKELKKIITRSKLSGN